MYKVMCGNEIAFAVLWSQHRTTVFVVNEQSNTCLSTYSSVLKILFVFFSPYHSPSPLLFPPPLLLLPSPSLPLFLLPLFSSPSSPFLLLPLPFPFPLPSPPPPPPQASDDLFMKLQERNISVVSKIILPTNLSLNPDLELFVSTQDNYIHCHRLG